ncbi:hypothetical protein FACS1894107_15940 [Planctomycetales bacterium]|nr:hypothetical protein FACS1894107_15940 [Planctomycetales bacterium]GHS98057.1 hypothetical protein FACS1894108_05530 [Planctomycetales bacterium]
MSRLQKIKSRMTEWSARQRERIRNRLHVWWLKMDVSAVYGLLIGWCEKVSVGAIIAVIFQGQTFGLIVAIVSMLLAFVFISQRERK